MNDQLKKDVLEIIGEYNKSNAFVARKLTDTPNDALSLVNRRYVTLNGPIANRPASSVATVGQRYFDITNNIPIWYTTSGWCNSVGSVVAGHR